jgi:hypothetical protein
MRDDTRPDQVPAIRVQGLNAHVVVEALTGAGGQVDGNSTWSVRSRGVVAVRRRALATHRPRRRTSFMTGRLGIQP